jgi:hypothetical protein
VGLKDRIRRIERGEQGDHFVLVNERTGEEFRVPRDAFLRVLGAVLEEEGVDELADMLSPHLHELVDKDTGQRFWFEDMIHSGLASKSE